MRRGGTGWGMGNVGGMKPPPAPWPGGRGGPTCSLNQRSHILEGADTHGSVASLGGCRGHWGAPWLSPPDGGVLRP